jgi:hypothetical protein
MYAYVNESAERKGVTWFDCKAVKVGDVNKVALEQVFSFQQFTTSVFIYDTLYS